MSKRRPEDVLKDIEDSAVDDAVERVTSMSSEERTKALEEAGFTAAELQATADAWHQRMQRAAVEDKKARLEAEARMKSLHPPPRRGRVVLLAAAVAVAAVVLALLLLPRPQQERPIAIPSATVSPTATMAAPTPSQSAPPPEPDASRDDKGTKPSRR